MAKTHWKKLTNPDYLGAYSIEDNKDLVLTIGTVKVEQVTGSDGKKDECVVCYWKEPMKPMILNSTNMKMIQKLLKSAYIEDWSGHKIQIGIEKVKAFGDVVEALRVRKTLPSAVEIKCEKCGAVIVASNGMSPEQLAQYTFKKYGAKMCAKCASELASAKKDEANETNG